MPVKKAIEFEAGMRRIKAVAGATDEDFKKLEKQTQQLGSSTSFSATQAGDGMKYLAMAKFDTNEIIDSIPDLMDGLLSIVRSIVEG